MGKNDTFYFLKVELGIDTCEEVAAIERLKHGPEYLWLWIRLALKYANYGGVLCRRIGEQVLPVTADDLEAEMKGGFTDVSIKDGVATLIQGSLIYINSDGFMAITGLTISGDPKEPTLHKQNSNTDIVRPLSIGNDTKSAVYQRERRKQLKEGDKKLQLPAPEKPMMSYADIAKKAGCIKQTVINHIKRLGWESHIVTMGQKKMVPESISRFLICKITGKNITPEIIEALPYGTYIAVETKPSRGYTLNTDWRVIFEIREDGKILDFTDSNNENLLLQQVIRGDVRVFKEDLELAELNGVDRSNYLDGGYKGGEAAHQDGEVNPSQAIGGKTHNALRTAHLNNIEFTITNVSTLSVLSDAGTLQEFQPGEMVTVIKTYYNDEVGAYIAETKDKALPYGTYTIQETKTNNAYLLTDGTPRTFEIETDGEIVTTDKQTHHKFVEGERMIFRNQIKRGEFEFVKIQGYTTERIQSLWVLENATSNEKHVLVTDPNGEYHSAEFDHSDNTNANDFLLDQIGDSYETMINLDAGLADGSITEYHGLWFGLSEDGDMAAVNDELNSLPYGQYTLHEVRTPSNDGMELQNFSFYITRDQKLVHLGTVTDYGITLSTTAKDAGSGTQTGAPSTNTHLIDTVKYNGVMDYGTYVLKTSLVYNDTGEPVLDSKGKEVTKETTVSLTKQSGTIEVTVSFDSTQMAGRSVVFFEELYDMEGNRVSGHTDLLDTNQTVSFAGIQTTLADTTPAEEGSGTVILTDTVKYSGLIVGKTYEMTGTLMNKKTGKALEGVDPVTVAFTPETSDGSVEVIFEVSSDLLKGNITVVAFESCTQDGIEIAVHADINDKNQTVEFKEPEIHTTATDQEDGDHYVKPSEHTVITDKVEYSNLTPGKTYKLTGVLMNQANSMPIDGVDPVTVEFTPTAADGYVTVTFELDTTSKLYYKIVVFEYLYLGDVEITAHNDITDKGQTVMVKDKDNPKPTPTPTPTPTPKPDGPKIHTMAYSAKDGYDYVGPDESVTIRDIVYYSNLTPGKEYEIRGILHKKHPDGWDMGELLSNGSTVTAYTVFTPQSESGTVELQFTFDATALNGYTAVVFEDLYQDGVLITSHADISDEDQAILISRSPRYRRRRISWVRTGIGSNMIIFGGLGVAAGAALIILLRKRSKLNKK